MQSTKIQTLIRLKLIPFIFLFTGVVHSQNIKGIVYDNQTTVKGLTVKNISQNLTTYTDDDGYFNIKAKVNDTLTFNSLFVKNQILIIKPHHFKEVNVIVCQKNINELDEVIIKKEPELKTFKIEEYNTTVQNQIEEDIKRRPYLYGVQPSSNFDLVAIANLIGKLFKRKNKYEFKALSYKDIDSLFTNDAFFNEELLTKEMHISKKYKYLFFEYCEAKQINKDLLKNENKFLLLDSLMKQSVAFFEFIKN